MQFTQLMDHVAQGFEVAGVVVLVGGFVTGLVRALISWRGARGDAYRLVRTAFGRSILLGLEILVAADLIRTIAVEPTARNVLVLGVIVLIRTFLSFSLEVEIDGRWPWQRWRIGGQRPGEQE